MRCLAQGCAIFYFFKSVIPEFTQWISQSLINQDQGFSADNHVHRVRQYRDHQKLLQFGRVVI